MAQSYTVMFISSRGAADFSQHSVGSSVTVPDVNPVPEGKGVEGAMSKAPEKEDNCVSIICFYVLYFPKVTETAFLWEYDSAAKIEPYSLIGEHQVTTLTPQTP